MKNEEALAVRQQMKNTFKAGYTAIRTTVKNTSLDPGYRGIF